MDNAITAMDVLQWLGNHIFQIIVVCGIFFEITPIKINPISWVLNLIFKPIREEISKLKSDMTASVDTLKTDMTSSVSTLKADIQGDISKVKTDLSLEINDVKTQMQTEIDSVKTEIDSVKTEQANQANTINELIKSNETSEIARIRWDILEFSNSIDNGQVHTRDEYRHIKDNAVRYHDLISKYNITNGIIDEEMEKINQHYEANKNGTSIYF